MGWELMYNKSAPVYYVAEIDGKQDRSGTDKKLFYVFKIKFFIILPALEGRQFHASTTLN